MATKIHQSVSDDLREYVKIQPDPSRKDLEKLDEQLAHNATETTKIKANTSNKTGAVVTFIDDNGHRSTLSNWKPIADEKGIKIGTCVITSMPGVNTDYLTFGELRALQSEGHEVYSHSHTHPNSWSTLTAEQIDYECKTSQDIMKQEGLNGNDVLVYSSSGNPLNFDLKNGVRKYYKYALSVWQTGTPNHNNTPVDNWCMTRSDGDSATLEEMKSRLDTAIAEGGWLVFFTHSEKFTTDTAQKFKDFIDYAKSLNVPILPFKEAEKLKGNAIAQGDIRQSRNKVFISHDGKSIVDSASGGVEILTDSNMDSPITDYKRGYTSIKRLPAGSDTYLSTGGTLYTNHFFSVDAYAHQIFIPYNKMEIHMRRWTGTAWSSWENKSGLAIRPKDQGGILTQPITYFAKNTHNICAVVANVNSPTGSAGVYHVYRLDDDVYAYAEFKQWSTNEMYRRRWDNTGAAWLAWEKVSVV